MKSLTFNRLLTMKSLVLAAVFLLPVFAFAQVPDGIYPNKIDSHGLKQGSWKKLDEQGTVIYVGQFKDDKPYGQFTYFDTDGRKMTEMTFVGNDGKVAYAKMYYISGLMQAQGKYVNQQKDSVWTYYDENTGLMLSTETWVNGKKEGKVVVYFPGTTQAASITIFKNGMEEGPYVEYYADGSKKEDATYVAGNLEGKATWYFPDGRINILGFYQHAVKNGTWMYYNADGSLKGKEVWKNGKLMSQDQVIKPDDLDKSIEQEPGVDGQDPNGGQGGQ